MQLHGKLHSDNQHLGSEHGHTSLPPMVVPALAEGESPDKRPQAAVEADRGSQTEDGYDPYC